MSKDTFLRELLGRMTVAEKCGQLNLLTGTMADTGTKDSDDREAQIRAGHCGAMLNVFTPTATRATLFFAGLIVTACASGFYHWRPDDIGLAIDRAGMSVAFAGLLGLLAATHVSDRAGRAMAMGMLLLAPAAVAVWFASGNVLPWALVQFGGIPLLLVFAFAAPPDGGLHVRWAWVVAAYAVAKVFEMNDAAIFIASGELLSGHTLKHFADVVKALEIHVHVRQGHRVLPGVLVGNLHVLSDEMHTR